MKMLSNSVYSISSLNSINSLCNISKTMCLGLITIQKQCNLTPCSNQNPYFKTL